MKNKESFLKELQNRLAVLEEAEQQDILAEYAQHIDLRVASGLSEEAAIQDFGDIDQLAAEILSAYHVKSTYRAPGLRLHGSPPDPRPVLRRGAAHVGVFFRQLWRRIAGGCLWIGSRLRAFSGWIGGRLRAFSDWLRKRPAEPDAGQPAAEETEPLEGAEATEEVPQEAAVQMESKEEQPVEHTEKKKTVWAALCRGGRRLGHGLWRLFRGAAWLVWNLFLLLCALPFVGLGLLMLMCLGALAVLLIQGYPLAGVTLCCLGGAACCVSILGLGSGLVWHRARPEVQAAAIAAAEETALVIAERGDDGR